MRFNRRMSMNMSVSNKSIGVKQIDKNYNNGEAVGAFRDVKRYVYPPQVADKSIYESASNGVKSTPCIADDHTVMTLLPKSSQDVESFQHTERSQDISIKHKSCMFNNSEEDNLIARDSLDPLPKNILVGMSAADGIGLSTSLSILSRYISEQGHSVALVDADLTHGGLDVLLGLESDEGRRLQEVDASLGKCDGYVLRNELLHWDNVDVLAFSPWHGKYPEPWVLEAAIRGLADAVDVVIVDIGSGETAMKSYHNIPQFIDSATLAAVELSVLDLARFRALLQKLDTLCDSEVKFNKFAVVGLSPRGLTQKSYVLSIDEASEYLSTTFLGSLQHDARMYTDIIGGYGIRNVPSSMKETMKRINNWLIGDVISNTKNAVTKYRRSQYRRSKYSRGKYDRK